ncbi:TMV resistance protein N-like isoform X1 [Pyrus x bretschneideri]|uniref:TMV resistance protein N-like isoform X1 n=1 Tax=Pyrus x bretschneideri TaxID=225117 RepID=UPI0020303C8C|nr:TMV resistance protein N-like isoform X1 [Pyrus x bretschneideri]XP_048421846.1 TMV resistance protein N-like isoform X1 [Pyrus x bretschneideri]XP_048421847.1 TMV resistance protein N-like isoform X1 [Pyrus x bretschneideri]XP_048421849.1 TMV resistance protein N-like isoform X1 [Pyrus x bretschneideri]XP_048421855.1 TMV resistance protein N-like isoform X1 [Pyrus x bretschneideri]XP_048421856.1 TMV resistance protein N-like isoform X1 [Pyrus x bretschneideri]XP_048421862.1 TMV resistance
MELIAFIQVFNIIGIVIGIGTLFYMCCRSLTFSSSSSSAVDSAVADCAAVADDEDADIPPRREKYDVFISFRGDDTRLGFTSHLHAALHQKKIETYIDNRLQSGEEIGPALRQAIEKSTISVIIFSQNYASSTWCLDELVHLLECKKRYGQMVIPVFYDINPSHVRKQHGSYADAFAQLEKRFENSIHKVHKWRDALTTAANLSGFDYSNKSGTEADLIQKVVDHIWTQLCRESSYDLKGFVGIEGRIKKIESLLSIHPQDACITVGIWGMGGIGKTTLAEAVFHKHSSKFEASCFLKNVTENSKQAGGLGHLEKTLLKVILKEEVLPIGSTSVRERLSRTRVLIVLDDVSSSMQVECLAGDRYGTGSRIIITTRDRGTLGPTVEEDNIYEVKVLKPDDALQLFCSRAFKNNSTRRTDYMQSAKNVVHYARGVPLALTILGSLFFNCKSKEEWEDEFNKMKRYPSESIQEVLRISYDRLDRNAKEIFLDIACFFKGWCVDKVRRMIHVHELFWPSGIRILIDMSLISIDSTRKVETIQMHDLLQQMGRTIVQEQCIKDPSKRNRLFTDEDVYHVLESNMETPNVEAIVLNWHYIAERPLKRADFKLMSNLRLLIVYGATHSTPHSTLLWTFPIHFVILSGGDIHWIHMPFSKFKELWKEEQILVNLQVIDLSDSNCLTEVPNLSGSLKIVEINLGHCQSLVEIPLYFQHLEKLTHLDLGYCRSLKYLPEMPGRIQYLDLQGLV